MFNEEQAVIVGSFPRLVLTCLLNVSEGLEGFIMKQSHCIVLLNG